MKFIAKIFFALLLLFNSSAAFSDSQSDIERDANKLLNWLEDIFPELLSPAQTQYFKEWCFRHYPDSTIYTGVVCGDDSPLSQGDVYAVVGSEVFAFGAMGQFAAEFSGQSDSDGSDSSSPDSNTSSPGGGNCVDIPFDAHEGITETLRTTANSAEGDYTFTTINQYLSVTDTRSVSKVTIDLGDLGITEATLTETYQIKDDYLWPSANNSESIKTSFGVSSTITTSTTFNPPYQASPVNTLCEEQSWTASGYTEIGTEKISTMDFSSDIGSSSVQMPGYRGTITSIGKSETVPAGTFPTVQMDYKMNDGFLMTIWISTDIGALVKMKLSGIVDGQTITSVTELTDLER